MRPFLENAKQKKSTLSISSRWARPGLTPNFKEFLFYFLIKLDGAFKGAKNLIAQRMNYYQPWTLVNDIFVFFLDVIDVRVVYYAGARKEVDLRWHCLLQTHNIPSFGSWRDQTSKSIDKLFISWQGPAVKEEKLHSPVVLMVDLSSENNIHFICWVLKVNYVDSQSFRKFVSTCPF